MTEYGLFVPADLCDAGENTTRPRSRKTRTRTILIPSYLPSRNRCLSSVKMHCEFASTAHSTIRLSGSSAATPRLTVGLYQATNLQQPLPEDQKSVRLPIEILAQNADRFDNDEFGNRDCDIA
jgi:hypothetical protein